MVHPTIQITFSDGITCSSVVTKADQTKSDMCTYVESGIQELACLRTTDVLSGQ